MAKPPKKIPRLSSTQTPTTSTHPSPAVKGTSAGDSGQSAASVITASPFPDTRATRPTVTISEPPASDTALSMTRAGDSVQQHALGTEPPTSGSPSTSEGSSETVFINPEFATQLTRKRNSEEGFLYDKRNKTYVELQEGIVMVGHAADGWRQTYAGESTPTGKKVEQIPGSTLWRETASVSPISLVQSAPATQRSPAPSDTRTLIDNLVSRQTEALDLSAGPWQNWGKSTRPESGDSIEIDGLHYPILAQNLGSESGLVYLQHPGFALDRFDAFESMLRDEPSRQPMWARKRDGHWQVLDGYPPFEMSPSQYVATAFRHLSQRSSSNLARAVFDRASLPTGINGDGLSVVSLTYRHWLDRVNNVAPGFGLAEPLLMLPKLSTPPGSTPGAGLLALPDYNSTQLQRLDFDPSKFPAQWAAYTAQPSALNLRTMFLNLLQDNGYIFAPPTNLLVENALIFHRPDIAGLFILKLPLVSGDQVPRYTAPGSNFADPDFLAGLGAENKRHLDQYLSQVEVAHLVGGVQRLSADTQTLFIVREG
ncbi:hypothetical protein JN757_09435 [Pseudomonas granadensis]|uniref:Uncharacterized protein n=1 Tax=Pseudomonas granadensis TaxID=1421430 RepID=A0ABX7GKN7_9PSED|nr:hypothetical protein [Pseudomonas granadensis]QRK85970.1 hypothetical protein JN757_09435 [Pseudomonas granadensis]